MVILFAPLFIGVWLPDIIFDTPRTLAEASSPDGGHFRVVQYWNHFDFYSTELHHTRPDGTTGGHTLDGDDAKSWSVPLVLDPKDHTATVTLSGGRIRTVPWQ